NGHESRDRAAERRAHGLDGYGAEHVAAVDLVALGEPLRRGEHPGGGDDDEPIGGEEVLAFVEVDGVGHGGVLLAAAVVVWDGLGGSHLAGADLAGGLDDRLEGAGGCGRAGGAAPRPTLGGAGEDGAGAEDP